MIDSPAIVLEALRNPVELVGANLFELTYHDGTVSRFSDKSDDLPINGVVYVRETDLEGFSQVGRKEGVSRDIYRIRFAGKKAELFDSADNPLVTGISLTVRFSPFYQGRYRTPLTVYRGFGSGITLDDRSTVVEFTGALPKLTGKRQVILTPDNQHARDSTDTALDRIHDPLPDDFGRE